MKPVLSCWSWIVILVVSLCASFTPAALPAHQDVDVADAFLKHVATLAIEDDLKKEVVDLVHQLGDDPYTRMESVTAGLTRIYPDYDAALRFLQGDNQADAVSQLGPFLQADDQFLAADASFFLARALINSQRHEEALPLLEQLSNELQQRSLHAATALYFQGVAQANLLENQRAIKSFTAFLNEHEDAPERLRVAAWRQIQTIGAIQEGAMDDVLQRMDYSRRRLEIRKTDDDTQLQQDKIIGMLAKLIKDQEKKECSNCSSQKNSEGQQQEAQGQSAGQGEGQGKSNAGGTSSNPNGVVRRTYENGPASPWSQLRDRTRDAANNAVKEKLPARYKTVVEKYYDRTSDNDK